MKHRVVALLLTLCACHVAAHPGKPLSPDMAARIAHVEPGKLDQLVELRGARARNPETFTSRAGKRHLKFTLDVSGGSYYAIVYAGDWTERDRAALSGGTVTLIGLWDEYGGQPSFIVKQVGTGAAPAAASTPSPAPSPPLLCIRDARINAAAIAKFVSKTQATHVKYTFSVQGKTYAGVMYAGSWNSAALNQLRSGRATLYGRWDTFGGKPNFVTTRVAP